MFDLLSKLGQACRFTIYNPQSSHICLKIKISDEGSTIRTAEQLGEGPACRGGITKSALNSAVSPAEQLGEGPVLNKVLKFSNDFYFFLT